MGARLGKKLIVSEIAGSPLFVGAAMSIALRSSVLNLAGAKDAKPQSRSMNHLVPNGTKRLSFDSLVNLGYQLGGI
jgi:hypothetical protein